MVRDMDNRPVNARTEDYLEAILRLARGVAGEGVRSSLIASALGLHRSTVSAALKSLKAQGLVDCEPYGDVSLTPEGLKVAARVAGAHVTLRRFFGETLGIDPVQADEAACGVEHIVPAPLLERISALGEFLRSDAEAGKKWAGILSSLKRHRNNEPPVNVVTPLPELPRGMSALVVDVSLPAAARKKLVARGIVPGTEILMVEAGGDAVDVQIRGYPERIASPEAKKILVSWLPGQKK
jgi:DtxR family Mn-dependent transcriptional regulator